MWRRRSNETGRWRGVGLEAVIEIGLWYVAASLSTPRTSDWKWRCGNAGGELGLVVATTCAGMEVSGSTAQPPPVQDTQDMQDTGSSTGQILILIRTSLTN